MGFHLINTKTGKELNLPKVKPVYECTRLQKGIDLMSKFYRKTELRMRVIDYSQCIRKNCVIIAQPLKKSWKPMFNGQTEVYRLVHNDLLRNEPSDCIVLNECPAKVTIKFDILCNRLRIEGRGVYWKSRCYKGKWVYLDDFEEEEKDE